MVVLVLSLPGVVSGASADSLRTVPHAVISPVVQLPGVVASEGTMVGQVDPLSRSSADESLMVRAPGVGRGAGGRSVARSSAGTSFGGSMCRK